MASEREPFQRRVLDNGKILLVYETLVSTQEAAKACVKAGETDVVAVQTHYQSGGKGRRGTPWIAPPNTCLLVTYLFHGANIRDAKHCSFSAGLAVAEAIEAITGLTTALKWPNDVLINGRKASGILIESYFVNTSAPRLAVLVGIGLNVNVDSFPPELAEIATSLSIETGQRWKISELEAAVSQSLLASREREWPIILQAWRARDCTVGRRYRATIEGEQAEGIAQGVSDEGMLLLQLKTGEMIETMSATSKG